MLTTDTGGVNSDSDDIVINVSAVDDAPVNPVEDRLPIEPEWFLSTDVINNLMSEWQIANDPTSPILSTIRDIRNEAALDSRLGVFQTDNATRAELIAKLNSGPDTQTYVQNSVRHLDLENSSSSVQQVVKRSQLESKAIGIHVTSADNTAIPAVRNVINVFESLNQFAADKKLTDSEKDREGAKESIIAPINKETNKNIDDNKPESDADVPQLNKSHAVDEAVKIDLKDNIRNSDDLPKEKSAKSFTKQIHDMKINSHTPSNSAPSSH